MKMALTGTLDYHFHHNDIRIWRLQAPQGQGWRCHHSPVPISIQTRVWHSRCQEMWSAIQ